MTEHADVPCARGCTRPVLHENGTRTDEPRPATEGRLCRRCSNDLRHSLRAIPILYLHLDPTPLVKPGDEGQRSGKRPVSPALALLDVLSLTDDRTDWIAGLDEDTDPLPVRRTLTGWGQQFAAEQNITWPDTFGAACQTLITWHSTVVQQDWIADLCQQADLIHRQLRHAVGVEDPHPVGRCINMVTDAQGMPVVCGKQMYARDNEPVTCPRCRKHYAGLDLVRLADTREQAEVAGRAALPLRTPQ